jgi:hypothetical protein
LRIFDRWGGLAFERVDALPNIPEHGWDGKANGEPINPGVFVWVAEVVYTDGKTETLTGDVTLLRYKNKEQGTKSREQGTRDKEVLSGISYSFSQIANTQVKVGSCLPSELPYHA